MTLLPFDDETIESFLIRVSLAQKIPYRYLAEMASLPSNIKLLDLFHTQDKTGRINLIKSLENKLNLPSFSLYKILVDKSDKIWGDNYTSYQYDSLNFPAALYRKEYIPICPLCLKKEPYIRINWHLQTCFTCLKHDVKLVHQCPSCMSMISYLESEIIDRCHCGANLMNIHPVTKQVGKIFYSSNKNTLGSLLFFKVLNEIPIYLELSSSQEIAFCRFHDHLDTTIRGWLTKQFDIKKRALIKRIDRCSFNEIWGDVILKSQNLPSMNPKENTILKVLQGEIKTLSSNINIPAFMTVNEAAVLLNKKPSDIKKDIGEGQFTARVKTLRNYVPIIDLRELSELL